MALRDRGYLFALMTRSELRARRLYTLCREDMQAEDRVVFAHRYTTNARLRPYSVSLSPAEFGNRAAYGCFAFRWHEQGEQHAAGVEVDHWLDAGLNVVLTVGAAALPALRRNYGSRLRVVFAPTLRGNEDWFVSRAGRGEGSYAAQLGLGLSIDENVIDGELDCAMKLSVDLDEAVAEFGHALRQQTPPLQSGSMLTSTADLANE